MLDEIEVKINGKEIPLNEFMEKLFGKMILSLLELLKLPENDSEIKTFEITGKKASNLYSKKEVRFKFIC